MTQQPNARVIDGTVYAIVFSKPSLLSECVCLLKAGDKCFVDDDGSTDCYYKIRSLDGAEGFCMRPMIIKTE